MPSCYFCGSEADIEKHHILPQRFDGSDKPSNIVDLCHSCHWKLERLYNVEFWNSIGVEDPRATKESHILCEYSGCIDPAVGRFNISSTTESGSVYRCEEHKPENMRGGSGITKKKEALANRLEKAFEEKFGGNPARSGEVRQIVHSLYDFRDLRFPDGLYGCEEVVVEANGATISVELVDGQWTTERLD